MSPNVRGPVEPRVLEGSDPFAILRGGLIAFARGEDVGICDPRTPDEPQVLAGHSGPVWALAPLPDGHLVSGSADETVRVWDLATGGVRVLEGHTDAIVALAVLPVPSPAASTAPCGSGTSLPAAPAS